MRLRTQLAVAMVALVGLTAGGVWVGTAMRFQRAMEPLELAQLEHDVTLLARDLQSQLDDVERDVRALAGALAPRPRSELAGSEREWLGRLFRSMAEAKPHYLQVRLLGPTGRELLRVERSPGAANVRTVAAPQLQRKDHRPYFRSAMALRRGEIYFSAIDLNREHGRIDVPHVPVLRASSPLFAGSERNGVVVINVAMSTVLDSLRPREGAELRVVDTSGSFLLHPDVTHRFAGDLKHGHRLAAEWPHLDRLQRGHSRRPGVARDEARQLALATAFAELPGGKELLLVETAPLGSVLTALAAARQATLFGGLVASLVAFGLAALVAGYLSRPLAQMAGATKGLVADRFRPIVPSGALEVRALAEALNRMAAGIATQRRLVERSELELRERAEQLASSNRALSISNDSLARYAHAASHDLKEPLRAVCSATQLLERRYAAQLDDRARQLAAIATRGSQRMARLIDQMLAYSRLDSTRGLADQVALGRVVDSVLRQLGPQLSRAGAAVRCSELPTVQGSEAQLSRVFHNLISNAAKYHGEASPEIRIAAERAAGGWELSVADNGIGIERKYQEKIFHAFTRLHTAREYDGTGLGLAMVKRIIELHGGRVWCESSPGLGSTFRFTLPDSAQASGPSA